MNARVLMGVALSLSLAGNAFLAGWLLSPRPQAPTAVIRSWRRWAPTARSSRARP